MKSNRIALLIALSIVAMSGGCKLPTQPITAQAPLPTQPKAAGPTALATLPLTAIAPTQAQAPVAAHLPTVTPPPAATASHPVVTPTSETSKPVATATARPPQITPVQGSYAVILVEPGDTLQVHSSPGNASGSAGALVYNLKNLTLTGKQSQIGATDWVEVSLPTGGTGWVDRAGLTEFVPNPTFCKDPQVDQLIAAFAKALTDKDGDTFSKEVSPVHGLRVQALRSGTVVDYDVSHASWVFESTYSLSWGKSPASGQDVHGSFSQVVLPNLLDVLNGQYTKTCNTITLGGASYPVNWPGAYENVNYVSLYRPGKAGNEQDWRTWLLGIEYVGGKPNLFSLNQYFWEP